MIFKAFNALMALLFLLSAAVQLNDPDPLIWITVYVLAALFCVAHGFRQLPPFLPFAFSLFTFLWALSLVPAFWGQAPVSQVFGHVEMKSEAVEVAREFGGLMIVSAWMLGLGLHEIKST